MNLPKQYGAWELKARYRKFVATALAISLLFHFLVASMYWLAVRLSALENQSGRVLLVRYADLGPPPSLRQELVHGIPSAKFSIKDFNYGTPVPIPDIEVRDERPFPTQEQLNEAGDVTGNGNNGGIMIPDSVHADLLGDDLEGITPDVAPVLLTMAMPRYPEIALRQKITGTVWVRVLVDERGRVKTTSVQKSDAEMLNQAAVEAARKCLFTPGVYRKRTIPAWVSIPIQFKLEQD